MKRWLSLGGLSLFSLVGVTPAFAQSGGTEISPPTTLVDAAAESPDIQSLDAEAAAEGRACLEEARRQELA